MAASLVLAPEAELDISEAYVWYESRRTGLGEEFLTAVDAAMEHISRSPLSYPVVYDCYRRILVRRFPYAVFFEYRDPAVTVFAIFHTSRHPEKWRQRLR